MFSGPDERVHTRSTEHYEALIITGCTVLYRHLGAGPYITSTGSSLLAQQHHVLPLYPFLCCFHCFRFAHDVLDILLNTHTKDDNIDY